MSSVDQRLFIWVRILGSDWGVGEDIVGKD